MAERQREPQRVEIYRTRPIERDPLPSAEEIAEKLEQHPQAVKIREGRFSDWIGKPISEGIWTAWGMKARVDKRGLTWSALNEISHIGDPPEVAEPHLTQVRYVKTYPLLPEELREKMSPKWGATASLNASTRCGRTRRPRWSRRLCRAGGTRAGTSTGRGWGRSPTTWSAPSTSSSPI